MIADPAAVPELIGKLRDPSRHQTVRLVHALRQFGSAAVPPLLTHAREHGDNLSSVADLLGSIGAAQALAELLAWCVHERAGVRAAAVRAIGSIGVEDRAYYHILRALNDEAADVRAAAAWALGRSGRQEAATYLAAKLTDQWRVAAESARALSSLGATGRRELASAAAREDGELARQVLWECSGASA
jgi:HEAT repeat protein